MKWLVLLVGVLCSVGVKAVDVSNETELRAAIDRGDSYIRLSDNISQINLTSTLTITSGERTLDLNTKKIYFDYTNTQNEAIAILVNGGNISVKNGTIEVLAAKGKKGTLAAPIHYDGYPGFNAVCIQRKSGKMALMNNVTLIAKPGEGGEPYKTSGLFKGDKGPYGYAYTIDPDTESVGDMLPGAYIEGASADVYTNTNGYPGTSTSSYTTTVKLTRYTALFSVDGSNHSSLSYTIAGDFTFPIYDKKGYKLSDWSPTPLNIEYINTNPIIATNHDAIATITFNATTSLIQYTINYDLQGGRNAAANPIIYSIQSNSGNPIMLNAPTKRGYDFSNWRDNNNVVTSIAYDQVASQAINNSYTLTAQWMIHNYKITYDINVQGKKEATFTLNDMSLPEPDGNQIPEGKEFDGWYLKSTSTKVEFPLTELRDIEVEAHWRDRTYYVTFFDGEVEVSKKSFTVSSGLASFDNPPAKPGYVFEYWMDTKENGSKVTSIPLNEAGDRSFYALWTPIQYTLTYDLKGGSYAGTNPVNYIYVERPSLLTEQDVSYTGYKFLHWILNGNQITEAPISGGTEDDGGRKMAFTVSAEWELIDYDIVFRENGGSKVDSRKYNVEEGVSEMPEPERAGYRFLGWFIGDKKYTSIEPGGEPLTLDAKWELLVYSIRYELNGGSNPEGAHSFYTYEDHVMLPTVSKEHYDFGGWFTNQELTDAIDEIPVNTTGDKTFYAKWSPKTYTLTLDPNGGTISRTEQKYVYGEVTKFARRPYRDNFDFAGWYYDKECTRPYGEKITADKSGDHTLYAKWTSAKYTIELDCYYGKFFDGTNVPTFYTYGNAIEKLPVPVRDGFSFGGWYVDDKLTTPVSSPVIKTTDSGNKTFYATWDRGYQVIVSQPSNGKITVTHNGNAVASGAMVGKGESLVVTATPATSDYVLKQLTVNGTTYTTSPQTVVMPEKDLKITAEFTISSVPAASAPKIILSPAGMDKFPKGENVKVQLEKTDEATTLYYRLDGSPEKAYSGEFLVESAKDTVLLEAIAKKEGYRDGVTTRYIIFDNGKITLTFDLPLGVKATNPTGGDVVTATTTGGSFEFMLTVDKNYYTNLDSMVVSANDSTITGNASGLYTLTNCSSDITVTVSGLKAKTCTVTLQQTENGQIKFTDGADETTSEVGYGSSVSITAVADEDFKFLQWNTGSQSNPLNLTVSRDTTISARFISDYKSYMMTLPQMEGVTVKPFSGYSTEVKKDGTFKFYLVLAKGYREGNLVVRANGEELTKNKGGYAIYHINKNISISVDGIVRDSIKLTLPDHVTAKVVETMSDVAGQGLFEETMLLLQAKAPEGKIFSKWTDGKTDNPRMATAVDAAQLIPLFTDKEDAAYAKVILNQSPGAGITGANSNMDAVKSGDVVQLKVVLLPAYSQSEVVLTADDKVLTPETSLRAASETKTYIYNLPVEKDGITVKVSGLKLNSYEVTVSQTNGGTVSAVPAGKVTHGDKVQLKAEAASGMLFVKWWDGNTLNPYPYTVASDTEVKACFVGTESTVDNESIRKDDKVSVSVTGRVLSVAVAEESALYIWDYKGSLFRNQTIPAGEYTMSLPSGVYLVKVGDMIVRKFVVR